MVAIRSWARREAHVSITHPKPVPTGTMTYDEFLNWADEDTLAEWVDGTVLMTSPASVDHQDLADFVHTLLKRFVAFHQLGKVLVASFQMKLAGSSGREPDVLFVARDHLSRLRQTYLDGAAALVVEVVSPESITRDREQKFAEYQHGGVPEYWILDPAAHQADFYQLDPQGAYQPVIPDAQGIYRAQAVPGFWVNVTWFWQDPLPDEDSALLEIIGKPYADSLRARMRQQGL